ncbi:MAG: OmpA family protein [Bacteroidales bacterium]|nr:OmpA family protein [Bacteroidales bacterium]
MRKLIFLMATCLISGSTLNAQTIYHPWVFEGGSNFTDFNFMELGFSEKFQNASWMGEKAPTMIRVGRMVKPWLTVSAIYSTVTLEVVKLNNIPLKEQIINDYFRKTGLQAEYRFANGKLLKEAFFIDPYLYTGFSLSSIDEKKYPGIPAGFGLNIWPLDYFGFNFQASYEYIFDFNNYMHYSIGLVVRFGNMIDKDHDRIPDRYDACPEIFGLEKQKGCPDYDFDGVVDSLDKCPYEFGSISSGGCPDFDNDGVPDKTDQCPCDQGPADRQGCPPTIDYARPPENTPRKSEPSNYELTPATKPDTIKMMEKLPQAVEEIIPREKEIVHIGIPVSDPTYQFRAFVATIDKHLNNIRFNTNSAVILPSSHQSLNEILKVFWENPGKQFIVEGYTDETGATQYNQFLSEERAKAVKNYFIDKGVDASRITAKGYGEIDDPNLNKTEGERAKNRRVEIYMK